MKSLKVLAPNTRAAASGSSPESTRALNNGCEASAAQTRLADLAKEAVGVSS